MGRQSAKHNKVRFSRQYRLALARTLVISIYHLVVKLFICERAALQPVVVQKRGSQVAPEVGCYIVALLCDLEVPLAWIPEWRLVSNAMLRGESGTLAARRETEGGRLLASEQTARAVLLDPPITPRPHLAI